MSHGSSDLPPVPSNPELSPHRPETRDMSPETVRENETSPADSSYVRKLEIPDEQALRKALCPQDVYTKDGVYWADLNWRERVRTTCSLLFGQKSHVFYLVEVRDSN
jgi:hypothetical protein